MTVSFASSLILIVLCFVLGLLRATAASESTACRPYIKHYNQHMEPSQGQLYLEAVNVKLPCRISWMPPRARCPIEVRWYKDGRRIHFKANGLTDLSPLMKLRRKGRLIVFSRVIRSTAGNYTCRVIPAGTTSRCADADFSCHPADTMSFIPIYVDGEMQEGTRHYLASYPPLLPSSLLPGRLYASRRVRGRQMVLLGYGASQAIEPFECQFVMSREQTASGWPVVEWHRTTSRHGDLLLTHSANATTGYSILPPAVYTCQAKDFGLARLTAELRRQSVCFVANMWANTVNRKSSGDYKCTIHYGNHSLEQLFGLGYTKNIFDRSGEDPGRRELPLATVWLNKNSTACAGLPFRLDCRVEPANSVVVLVRLYSPQIDSFGELVRYARAEPLGRYEPGRGSVPVGPANATAEVSTDGSRLFVSVVLAGLSDSDDGYYACAAITDNPADDYSAQEYMRLHVRSDCLVGNASMLAAAAQAAATASRAAQAVYVSSGVAGCLLAGAALSAVIGIALYARRRAAPIVKRIVYVDNADLYHRHPARRDRVATKSTESSATATSLSASEDGTASSSLSSEQQQQQQQAEQPFVVPEVRVVRIRPSRTAWGFGSRRQQQELVGANASASGVSDANKEVRYVLPACPVLEVDRKRVSLFRSLGEGAFGTVHAGQLLPAGSSKPLDVAVKMLKRDYTEEELLALCKEMQIMKFMSSLPHPNIVKLVGICTKNGPFMLLVELAHHGNMRDFLKERCLEGRVRAQYQNLRPGTKQMQYYPCVSNQLLLQFSRDVASALDFMASIKIVHRDIAARNILVANHDMNDGRLVAKVADFGLTRNVQDKDYYRVITEGKLPVKWLAPECLKSRIFSTESDV